MKDQILALRAEGKSYRQIQKELGCSKGTISFHLGIGQKEKTAIRKVSFKEKGRAWLTDLKSNLSCQVCGESRWWVLDFHHRDPLEKERGIAKLIKEVNLEKVKKEIDKCDVLCANCHRDLHYKLKENDNSINIQKV